MSFRFNFIESKDEDAKNNEPIETKSDEIRKCEELERNYIEDETAWDEVYEKSKVFELENGEIVRYMDSEEATDCIHVNAIESLDKEGIGENEGTATAVQQNSDIIPNVYEGGLKIWECSMDLTEHLSSLQISFRGLHVLELGCGAALPGLYAYKNGATVHFQDYNKEVLEMITMTNVQLNSSKEVDKEKVKFFSGDWRSFLQFKNKLPKEGSTEKYDLILTSETIYNTENYQIVHNAMRQLLKEDGVALIQVNPIFIGGSKSRLTKTNFNDAGYVASKVHYFGVGGGTRGFEDLINKEQAFDVKVCKEFSTGLQREILEMRLKEKHSKKRKPEESLTEGPENKIKAEG